MNNEALLALIPAGLNEDTYQDVAVALLEAQPIDHVAALAVIKRAINTAEVRERRHRKRSFEIFAEPAGWTDHDPLRAALYAAIDGLAEPERNLLISRYEQGASMGLLGAQLNVSQPTLRKKLRAVEETLRLAFI